MERKKTERGGGHVGKVRTRGGLGGMVSILSSGFSSSSLEKQRRGEEKSGGGLGAARERERGRGEGRRGGGVDLGTMGHRPRYE